MNKWSLIIERYLQEGRTVSGGCGGSSSQENDISKAQAAYYNQLTQNAQAEFGDASQIFGQLTSAFTPILNAGPNQQGFSPAEMNLLNSTAANTVGETTAMGQQAINGVLAREGGPSALPSGAAIKANVGLATGAGNELANLDTQNQQQSFNVGRQNWLTAAGILSGAPSVFSTSTGAAGVANQSGSDAFSSAHTINTENNSWMGDVMGILGDATKIGSSLIGAGAFGGGGGGGGSTGGGGGWSGVNS